MISPIPPASSGVTGPSAVPLTDAVQVYGATQQAREERRAAEAVAERDEPDFQDRVSLDLGPEPSKTPADGSEPAASQPRSAGGEAPRASGGGRYRAEDTTGRPRPGQDGADQARDAALAQHAAEQQGIVELQRGDAERKHRSTRDMMGKLEGLEAASRTSEGKDVTSVPAGEAKDAASTASGAVASEGAGAEVAEAGGEPASAATGGGGAAASAGGSATTASAATTSALIRAAVGSGVARVEKPAPGSAQSDDRSDDEGQQTESSQEGVRYAAHEAPVQGAGRGGLDARVGLGSGWSGARSESEAADRRGEGHRGMSQGGEQGTGSQHREGDPSQARREEAPAGSDEPASPADASPSEVIDAPQAPDVKAALASVPAGRAVEAQDPSALKRVATQEGSASGSSPERLGGGQDVGGDAVDDPATRTAVALREALAAASASAGLLQDEYFFFDDARAEVQPSTR